MLGPLRQRKGSVHGALRIDTLGSRRRVCRLGNLPATVLQM